MTRKLFTAATALFLMINCNIQNARADEIWNFTRITCVPELNYFEASVVEIDGEWDKDSEFINNNQEKIRKKYGLRGESLYDIQECKLKDVNLKVQIKYRSANKDGICGRAPSAILKFWIDDKLTVDLGTFNDICTNGKGVVQVGFKIKNEESKLYFKKKDYMGTEDLCVIWLDSKTQNIKSNDCKLETIKSIPIKDNYIIDLISCPSCAVRDN